MAEAYGVGCCRSMAVPDSWAGMRRMKALVLSGIASLFRQSHRITEKQAEAIRSAAFLEAAAELHAWSSDLMVIEETDRRTVEEVGRPNLIAVIAAQLEARAVPDISEPHREALRRIVSQAGTRNAELRLGILELVSATMPPTRGCGLGAPGDDERDE